MHAVNNNLVLFLSTDAGQTLPAASHYAGIVFALSGAGKLLFGSLYDTRHAGAFGACATMALVSGCLLLLHVALRATSGTNSPNSLNNSPSAELLVFSLVYGLGYGGAFIGIQSRAASHYGERASFRMLQARATLLPA